MSFYLKIVGCTDSHRWYSSYVGKLVPFLGDAGGGEYKSKEPPSEYSLTGCLNFVQYEDAIIVEGYENESPY